MISNYPRSVVDLSAVDAWIDPDKILLLSGMCPAEFKIYMIMGPIAQLQTPCSDPSIIYKSTQVCVALH
jgi:hypothetical protein